MKLALVSREYPPNGGGIGSYTQKTAMALAAAGHEVHVFTEGWRPSVEIVGNVTIHRDAPSRLRPRVVGRALTVARALLQEGPFDLVQACEWDAEASIYSLVRARTPLVTRLATPHYLVERLNQSSRPFLSRALSDFLERLQAVRSDVVISPSRALADEVTRAWRLSTPISIVPTGIEMQSVHGDLPPELENRCPYVLYFGRLELRKGVDTLLEALGEALPGLPDVSAVLVGEDVGIHGTSFAEYARAKYPAIRHRLVFLPRLPHPQLFPIVQRAELVVLPSRWENLANAALEAMALGRAVIATSGSGFDEVITDGANGWLVPPGDARALSKAIDDAMRQAAARERIGAAALERARSYALAAMASRLLEVHLQVVRPRAAVACSSQ